MLLIHILYFSKYSNFIFKLCLNIKLTLYINLFIIIKIVIIIIYKI